MSDQRIKQIISILIVGVFFIPMLQRITNRLNIKPLHGDIGVVEQSALTWSSWIDGSYQDQTDLFLQHNFGYQPFFIRLNNQIKYSLFQKISAQNVIEGKDGYLYEENYIRAYFGKDFIGEDSIAIRTNNLIRLRDTLLQSGTELLIVIAPGKGSFFPEFFPKKWTGVKQGKTNYEGYKKLFAKSDLNVIDMKDWIEGMKGHSKYPLFPKCGIHWSKYTEYLAADSLLRYIKEKNLANVGGIDFERIELSSENRDGDYDIADGMNLLFNLDTYPMAYPIYQFDTLTSPQNQPVLVIADSYYWGLFNKGMSERTFGGGQFWFYNIGIYPDSYTTPVQTLDLENYIDHLAKNKLVILLSTDANLYRFPFNVDVYSFEK